MSLHSSTSNAEGAEEGTQDVPQSLPRFRNRIRCWNPRIGQRPPLGTQRILIPHSRAPRRLRDRPVRLRLVQVLFPREEDPTTWPPRGVANGGDDGGEVKKEEELERRRQVDGRDTFWIVRSMGYDGRVLASGSLSQYPRCYIDGS